jgi:hypothetical protein
MHKVDNETYGAYVPVPLPIPRDLNWFGNIIMKAIYPPLERAMLAVLISLCEFFYENFKP